MFDLDQGQVYYTKFVSDLCQVGDFLQVLHWMPRYNWNIVKQTNILFHCFNPLYAKLFSRIIVKGLFRQFLFTMTAITSQYMTI